MEVDVRTIVLEPLLEGVISVVEPVAEAKGVRLDLVVARTLPQIVSDARHVRQILMNLMTNAIKFTERGSVTIVAKQVTGPTGDAVSIAIEDTGIGIARADLTRIFDEFEQVRPGGRGDSIARGTGLGLAVSRKLARLLGGEVTVDSQIGHGSRFTLVLPLESYPVRTTSLGGEATPAEHESLDVGTGESGSAGEGTQAAAERGGRP